MAIIAPQTAPNFSTGDYHKIVSAQLLCSPDEPVPRWHYIVGFYASAAARELAPGNPMWTRSIFVTVESIVAGGGPDPRVLMYEQIMADPAFAGTNATSDVVPVTDDPAAGSQPDATGTTSATTG
jgi:hypothetical protein